MVKRATTKKASVTATTVQDAQLVSGIKKKGNWLYPDGVIQRHPDLIINGQEYYDPKELPQKMPRRKIESSFFITINTNRQMKENYTNKSAANSAMRAMLSHVTNEEQLCSLIVFGPKDKAYEGDRYADVIDSVVVDRMSIELGENMNRLHAHIMLTIHHYSQIQINKAMLQHISKEVYNRNAPTDMQINGKPYVHIELLPQSNFMQVMKNYIHKNMIGDDDNASIEF